MTKASRVRRWRCDWDWDICRNRGDMPAPRGAGLCMKLNGCLPRSGRWTGSATLHNAPLAWHNQEKMLLRSLIRSNAADVKSRRLSQAKKRYVTAVRSPHVYTPVDPPSVGMKRLGVDARPSICTRRRCNGILDGKLSVGTSAAFSMRRTSVSGLKCRQSYNSAVR